MLKRKMTTVVSALFLVFFLAACSSNTGTGSGASANSSSIAGSPSSSSSSSPVSTDPQTKKTGKYKIALNNSFMGNDWRQEMQHVAEAVAKQSAYKDKVDFKIVNMDNSPAAQSASIDALVQQGYNAILVDASSPTALNESIERAIKAGVVIVSFDQVVTAPNAYKIDTDFTKAGKYGAEYLAKAIGGKGNVVIDRGLPGAPISKVLTDAAMEVFKKYPDIKVVGEFDGQYAQGPTEQGMASVLSTQPKVDAIYTQGYVTSVYNALKAAKRALVPTYGQAYNGNFVSLTEQGANGIITVNTPGLGALAMKTALNVLEGQNVEKEVHLDPEVFVTDTTLDIGTKPTKIEAGKNAFPDLSPGLTWPAAPAEFNITTDQALGK